MVLNSFTVTLDGQPRMVHLPADSIPGIVTMADLDAAVKEELQLTWFKSSNTMAVDLLCNGDSEYVSDSRSLLKARLRCADLKAGGDGRRRVYVTFPNAKGDVSLWGDVNDERGSRAAYPGEAPAAPFLLGLAQYSAEACSPHESKAEADVSVVRFPGLKCCSVSIYGPGMEVYELEDQVREKLTRLGVEATKYELHGPGNDHEAAALASKKSSPTARVLPRQRFWLREAPPGQGRSVFAPQVAGGRGNS